MTARKAHSCEVIQRMITITRKAEGTPLRDQIEGNEEVRTVYIFQGLHGDANLIQCPDMVADAWIVSTPPPLTHTRLRWHLIYATSIFIVLY